MRINQCPHCGGNYLQITDWGDKRFYLCLGCGHRWEANIGK